MPLNVEIIRNGKALEVWNDPDSFRFVSYMYTAALKESCPDEEYRDGKVFGDLEGAQWVDFSLCPIYYLTYDAPLVARGEQTLLDMHEFEGLILEPGDILRAWRSHR